MKKELDRVAYWSKEVLIHYRCSVCSQWWSIGDDEPQNRDTIVCPHCSSTLYLKELKNLNKLNELN